MNDGLEYAKMIEIPVSSCEYVKQRKFRLFAKKKVVKKVNEQLERTEQTDGNAGALTAECAAELPKEKRDRRDGIITAQVVAAFALVVAIILTNIFWENSAMNTLFKSVFGGIDSPNADERVYSDFSLNLPVKSEGLTLVEGVLSVNGEYSLYPVCEGAVKKIDKSTDGTYTLTIRHSDNFTSVIEGADFVYAGEGDKVNPNMPVCHTSGQASVYLYENGNLLTDYAAVESSIVFNK